MLKIVLLAEIKIKWNHIIQDQKRQAQDKIDANNVKKHTSTDRIVIIILNWIWTRLASSLRVTQL